MKKNLSQLSKRKNIPKCVFDTSSVIALIEICQLGGVLQKFSKKTSLYVPHRVRDEFLNGPQPQKDIVAFKKIFSISSVILKKELLPYFNFDSDCGEIWVISYAIKNPECWCVMDEEFGRNICRLFKVKLIGTMGIISHLRNLGYLTNTDLIRLKKSLRDSTFYLPEKFLTNEE